MKTKRYGNSVYHKVGDISLLHYKYVRPVYKAYMVIV